MTHPTIRPASRGDISSFSLLNDVPTVKAWCAEIDGTIIGMGGLAFSGGRWFAFINLTEEARPYKMTIMRMAKRTMAEAQHMGIRFVYADADIREPRAVTWLKSLGFELDPRSNHLFRWKNPWQH